MSTSPLTDYQSLEYEEMDRFERIQHNRSITAPVNKSRAAIRGARRAMALRSNGRRKQRPSGVSQRRRRQMR